MEMNIKQQNDKLYIALSGEIDHHSIKEIRDKIDNTILTHVPKELYLDLEQIDFMDSSGLGLVLGRMRIINSIGGKLFVQNPSSRIFTILHLAGVDKLLQVVYKKEA